MQVLSLANASGNNDPLRTSVGRLIETVGTTEFETQVFEAARNAIHCEHVFAFVAAPSGNSRVLMSAVSDHLSIPRETSESYMYRYWDRDPANQPLSLGRQSETVGVRILPDEDIKDDEYRTECFTNHRLVDRLSITRRHGTQTYRINFYGGGRHGRFADSDVGHMMNSADILMSLLVKHDNAALETSEERLADSFHNRLSRISPKMPTRETQVCTAIMLGMTSEAIALKLGISVNTVLTYRKRAYGRLNISCQNELMRLILC
jgi:DNA-directed RNA polymerase specialized sigma24 family protein